jgi:hypothetical protein
MSDLAHSTFKWYEIRCENRFGRQLVQLTNIQKMMDPLGTRPTNVHLSICRLDQEAYDYSLLVDPERKKKKGSIRGFRGRMYGDYVVIDLDGKTRESLPQVLEALHRLIEHLEKEWGLEYEDYLVYFSGQRGFHVFIPTASFGRFEPDKAFHAVLYELLIELLQGTTLIQRRGEFWDSEFLDMGIYTPLHMIRMPHTIHEATQLWKNPIRKHELESVDMILEACRSPRARVRVHARTTEKTLQLGEHIRARIAEGGLKHRMMAERTTGDMTRIYSTNELVRIDLPGYAPYVEESNKLIRVMAGPLEEGKGILDLKGRNQAMAYLCGICKGRWQMSKDEARAFLHNWNASVVRPPLDDEEFVSVLDSLFD